MITFEFDAHDAMVTLATHIPQGYIVALLGEGEEPTHGKILQDVDVAFISSNYNGVAYRNLDSDAEPVGPIKRKSWADIARIHIY